MMKSFPQTSGSHSEKGKIDCALDCYFLPVNLSLIAAKSKSVRDLWRKKENPAAPSRQGSGATTAYEGTMWAAGIFAPNADLPAFRDAV